MPSDRGPRICRESTIASSVGGTNVRLPGAASNRVNAKDGTVVWLHSKATLVRDATGTPKFWHGVSMDVSALHRAEEQVRKLEPRYEQLTSRETRSEGLGD